MKKTLIFTFLVTIGLIIFIESGAFNSFLMFLLVGAIPGTSYSVPSGIMLLAMITIIWVVIFRLAAVRTFYSITTTRLTKRHADRKKRLPSRRYSEI